MSDGTNLAQGPGLLGPLIAAFLCAAGFAGVVLGLGGGALLALVGYSLGGSVLLLALATAAALRPATTGRRAVGMVRMRPAGVLRHG